MTTKPPGGDEISSPQDSPLPREVRPIRIRWRDCRQELPEDGQKIFVLDLHRKKQWPESYRIYGMEAEIPAGQEQQPRACECDGHGGGSWCVYFDMHDIVPVGWYADDMVRYWVPADELAVTVCPSTP